MRHCHPVRMLLPDIPLLLISDCSPKKQNSAAEAWLTELAPFQQPQLLPAAAPHQTQYSFVTGQMWGNVDWIADLAARTAELKAGLHLLTPP